MPDNDEEFDKKIDRAKKAMDVMQQLGAVFGSTKKIISEPIQEIPSLIYVEEKLDKILANQVLIIADTRALEKKMEKFDKNIEKLLKRSF